MKRVSPMDADRLAERIMSAQGGTIKDKDSFDEAYDDYMPTPLSSEQDTVLREEVFKNIKVMNPSVRDDNLFKKAGGKDLKKDRRTRAKKVVKTPRQYIKAGAQKVDLEGYDTPQTFRFSGRAKGRQVFAKEVTITRRKRTVKVFRDKRGRFVKVS